MDRFVKLPDDRPALMAILNVTPDSFSEHGLYQDPRSAIEAGFRMLEEGADIIDVGGESTRPGAPAVSIDEELRRVLSVVETLANAGATVSIDTRKPEVARKALESGAKIVNDVSGLRDTEMIRVCAEAGATVCIMHMLGTPETMQKAPHYEDVVEEVKAYLEGQAQKASEGNILKSRIWIDPGIGFGKTLRHNLLLLNGLDKLVATGYPVLVGVSRKSFLGRIVNPQNPAPVEARFEGTLAAQTIAQMKGARIIRSHDVLSARRAIDAAAAILNVMGDA